MDIILSHKAWLYWGVILSFLIILTIPYNEFVLLGLLVISLLYIYKEKFIVIASIAVFLVFTKKNFSEYRDIVTVSILFFIFIHFISKYKLEFKYYPVIPKETLFFVLFLFLSAVFSTLFIPLTFNNIIPIIRTILFFAFCYYLYSFIKGKEELNILIYSLFIVQIFIAFFILKDFYNEGLSFFYKDGVLARFAGISDNPNIVGLITSISTNFILVYFFSEKFATFWKKILLSFLILNNLIIMIFADSRAATIAILVGGAIILLTFNKKAFWITLTTMASIIFILFLIPSIQSFLLVLIRPQGVSMREPLWNSGVEMFFNHPMTGVGPEQFSQHFYSYLSSVALQLFTEIGALEIGKVPSPHNFFLIMGAENGIPGVLAGISLFVCYFYMSIKLFSWRSKIDHEDFLIVVALFATGVGTLFRAFFEISGIFHYGFISNDLPFWICIISLSFLFNKYKYLRISKVPVELP